MPRELSAIMIKTSRDPKALRPEIEQFPFTSISSVTRGVLADVEEHFPGALATSEEGGAMLTAEQAIAMTGRWQKAIADDVFHTHCQATQGYVHDMAARAKAGFSMLLVEV